MNFPVILTTIAPALILFLVCGVTRFFPPSIDNSYISKAPQWWSRDQETWDKANTFLASKYLLYAIILAIFCGSLLFFEWEYASALGYIVLVLFFLLANFQVRAYMQDKVK